jgi:GntR family transcriptional regulator
MSENRFELRRDSAIALYQQLAEYLAGEISAGRYKPYDRLPTEPELSERFGVSRITVRQAIEHLLKQGLVERKQGKGTFVAGPVVRHELQELKGIIDELRDQGVSPETKLLEFTAAEPTTRAAQRLHRGGALTLMRRLYSLNGAPFALATTYLPAEAAHRVSWAEAEAHPAYTILKKFLGLKIARAELSIRARPTSRELARLLRTPVRAPLLEFERVSFCSAGHPREYTQFSARSENYEFAVSVKGPLPISSVIMEAV